MKHEVLNTGSQKVDHVDLSDKVFGAEVKPHLFWEVVRNQLANRRAGTKKTKGRSEVDFTGSKMYRQKGTGRARAGSARSGVRVGGGHIHNIEPKDWSYKIPKKVRRQAVQSALSMKVAENKLTVVNEIALDEIKTKKLVQILAGLGMTNGLVIIAGRDEKIEKSARNIPFVKVLPVEGLNVYDLLRYDRVIVTRDAVAKIEGRFAQ
ncbi:MAG: 50S ribosomal protein L4 [Deltaproteobacteria bacterium]|nr:50S ribosomal protein L4 [Deltaproteobacteria bacterium]